MESRKNESFLSLISNYPSKIDAKLIDSVIASVYMIELSQMSYITIYCRYQLTSKTLKGTTHSTHHM